MASSIEQLLSLSDEAFIRRAYANVLGCDPDPVGLNSHLALIRSGESRLAILAMLRLSEEGRLRGRNLAGLDRVVRLYRWRRLPLIGPILRLTDRRRDRVDVLDKLIVIETKLDYLARLVPSSGITGSLDESQVGAGIGSGPSSPKAPESVVWRRPLRWKFEGNSGGADDLSLIHVEIERALAELGHDVTSASLDAVADVTVLVAAPPLPRSARKDSALLAGHDWEESGFPADWVDQFNANLLGVACVSEHATKILIDQGVTIPVAAIGMGVDHWERISCNRHYRAPGKRFRFLYTSSSHLGEGIDLLLESFERMFDVTDDVSLIIKPTDAPARELVPLLNQLREANARFPDVVLIENDLTDAELKALYGQCQVFVAPSRAEGFGLPIAQALLSGLPVITTAWGGHRAYCDETSSWLVDYHFRWAKTPRDPIASVWAEPIASSLDEALSIAYRATPAERFARSWSGRKRLLQCYTWKDAALRLAGLAERARAEAIANPEKARVGLITTWNVKCGIATYAQHLMASVPSDDYVVFAARQEPRLRRDKANCLRIWDVGKDTNGLGAIVAELSPWSIKALVIHFNYGFFNHAELSDFIELVLAKGIVVIIDFHSTVDGKLANYRLTDFLGALRKCHRLLAHGPSDMDRLKALGLVNNVMLFPLGVMIRDESQIVAAERNSPPLIASFGFCLPNKGLLELVQAVDLLKQAGKPVRLRMLNAEHPDPSSAVTARNIKQAVEQLGLQEDVELCTEYLEDEVCLALLREADLVVNPYQQTTESASASVRYGLAAGRPVGVTPLSIFDDLGGAVFRMPGMTPHDIAQGIASALGHLEEDSETARCVRQAARRWLEVHDCARQSTRLMRMASALARREAWTRTAEGAADEAASA
ncbi:MAG: glycosyltransferase [Steroidobacteraceae bacterium]|jgi:glycosyltransferase involved in cell wall biosynthesis